MANLIVVCGPQAVGKMTVAESLRDKLKYNMMMNHDSIEFSDRIFGFNTPAQREFNSVFRKVAFELAVKHNVDLIFTYVAAFEKPEIEEVFDEYRNIGIDSQKEKNRIMKNYRKDLIVAGMTEEEADDEVEGWCETNWS